MIRNKTVLFLLSLPLLFDQQSRSSETQLASLTPPSVAEQELTSLDWLLGHWLLTFDSGSREITTKRSSSGAYLESEEIQRAGDGKVLFTQRRIIAWNPISELFETWLFRNDGSFGGGTIELFGNQWMVPIRMILADGRTMTGNELYTPRVAGGFIWQEESRTLNGLPLPSREPTVAQPVIVPFP